MTVITKNFLKMVRENGVTLEFIANELWMTLEKLKRMLIKNEPFTYTESEMLMYMFGADEMMKVIDWRITNARSLQ